MSLNFCSAFITPAHVAGRAQDDLYLRGPVLLANAQTNPLTTSFSPDFFNKTWRMATVGKEILVEGPRFENALWRSWAQYIFARGRTLNSGIEWESFMNKNHHALFVPLVVSEQTCHRIEEMPLVHAYNYNWAHHIGLAQLSSPRSIAMEASPMDSSLTLSIRSCLKGSNTASGSESPASFRTTSSASPNVRVKRNIVFNSYVSQSVILETPSFRGDAYGCVVLDDTVSDDEMEMLRSSRRSRSRSHSSAYEKSSPELAFISALTSATLKRGDFAAIQALPPAELFPPPCQDELNSKIMFVPPIGMDYVGEENLVRSERIPLAPKLRRTISSRELTLQRQELELENALAQLGAVMNGNNTILAEENRGGDVREGVERTRRVRRKHAKFSTGDDEEEPAKDWVLVKSAIASITGLDAASNELEDANGSRESRVEKNEGGARGLMDHDIDAVNAGLRVTDLGKEGPKQTSIEAITEGLKGHADDTVYGNEEYGEGVGGEGVMVEEEGSSARTGGANTLFLVVVGGIAGVGAWLRF